MIDNEFERKGREMSDKLNQIVDLEYTWGDFPALTADQIYANYDARAICAHVKTCNGAAILSLQAENDKLRADLKCANIQFAALTNIVNTHMMLSHDGAACMLCGTVFVSKDRQAMADYCFTHTVLCAAHTLTPIQQDIIGQLRAELEQANKRAKAERDELKNKRINDRCPACGHDTLFVSDAGYLTCSFLGCKEPGVMRAVKMIQTERDAALEDARILAQNWNGVMTSVEIEAIVKKYLSSKRA